MESLLAAVVVSQVQSNYTHVRVLATYSQGDMVPIAFWPRGNAWLNPCKDARDLCCLKVARVLYRNDALVMDNCTPVGKDFVTSSTVQVQATSTGFEAVVPVDTAWVSLLFVHYSPAYVVQAHVPIQSVVIKVEPRSGNAEPLWFLPLCAIMVIPLYTCRHDKLKNH